MTDNTPAERILARFGVDQLAKWTGRHRSRVHAWAWPTEKGGTGGFIPVRVRAAIAEGALRDLGETVAQAEFELKPGEGYLISGAPPVGETETPVAAVAP